MYIRGLARRLRRLEKETPVQCIEIDPEVTRRRMETISEFGPQLLRGLSDGLQQARDARNRETQEHYNRQMSKDLVG